MLGSHVPDNQPDLSPVTSGIPALLVALFVIFGIFFLSVLVLVVVSSVKRYRAAKAAGLDPFAADVQLMGRAANSAALAPLRSSTDRLAEIDDLLSSGTISATEHQSARARIIGAL